MTSAEQVEATVTVTVTNWSKYNPRKDYREPRWFAFSNRLIEDDAFYSFSAAEFKAWVYILSKASQKNSAEVIVRFVHAKNVCGIEPEVMKTAIEKLQKIGVISFGVQTTNGICTGDERDLNANDRDLYSTVQYSTNSTEQYNTNTGAPEVFRSVPFIEKVSAEIQNRWLQTFPDHAWLLNELTSAANWLIENRKTKKNYATYFGGWLRRASNPSPQARHSTGKRGGGANYGQDTMAYLNDLNAKVAKGEI